jgi:translation elongation factor EF-4
VYAGVFPMDSADFNRLEEAMERVSSRSHLGTSIS